MREIAIATVASGTLIALAVALAGRWHVAAFASGSTVRTVIVDTWTGAFEVCTTVETRTTCAPVAAR